MYIPTQIKHIYVTICEGMLVVIYNIVLRKYNAFRTKWSVTCTRDSIRNRQK